MLIHKYNPKWKHNFSLLKKRILSPFETISNIYLEHIGSTSVPHLDAKPIIDIDLVFNPHDIDFKIIESKLNTLGYFHNGNQGIPNREVFKREDSSLLDDVLDKIDHHLYVCPHDSLELKRHLIFRDYLRTHLWAKNYYQHVKYELAEISNHNRSVYSELKEKRIQKFVEDIIEKTLS